ncbi:MAG: hypothetical protein GY774_35545 [Planctomycetes bacterium]|nr:hypothetical protein [Planctomycetota bacterium]
MTQFIQACLITISALVLYITAVIVGGYVLLIVACVIDEAWRKIFNTKPKAE